MRRAEGVTFWIHVTPGSRRPGVGGSHADCLRVAVREPPREGRANAACADALARALGVPRGAVQLDPGARGRRKRVDVAGPVEDLVRRLDELATVPTLR